MDDQLDNDLKNRIREVFDNYEDTSADEGWLLLREKFPEEGAKRRPIAWIWWGAAAVVLLFSGLSLWLLNKPDTSQNTIVKAIPHPNKQKIAVQKVKIDTVDNAGKNIQTVISRTHHYSSDKGIKNSDTTLPDAQKYQAQPITATTYVDTIPTKLIATKRSSDSLKLAANKTVGPVMQQAVTGNANVKADDNKPQATQSVVLIKKQQKSITDMFNDDKGTLSKKNNDDDDDKAAKKVSFGVYAGTYFNYAKGSDNEVNVGAGVTSDIKLTKNLKLVTGVAVAQNSLSYQAIPLSAISANRNFATPATGPQLSSTPLSAPTVKNYNASLVGLDVPVNLKYEFNPQKSDAYVSLGLSSGTFIDESYTYKYNYPSFLSPTLQQTQNETTGKNFNGFYFAKTLNVAFGLGYPLGKNRLVLEPFLKYPLDGMGSQNLRFGAGGINLKFNFLSQKK